MIVFLNGQFVPDEQALVSVFDRGFLYGDGLFETIFIWNGKPFRWTQHLDRFETGARFLNIPLPFPPDSLFGLAGELLARNQCVSGLLRLSLSRGMGVRGYSPKGATRPTLVMSLHPAPARSDVGPPGWRLITSSFRLPANEPLAQFKTCNKLPQILARAQADAAGADEALLADSDGLLIEGSASNLFWITSHSLNTPPLAAGVLPGVTRAIVFELADRLDCPVHQTNISREQLRHVDGIFLSLSSVGIAEAVSLDEHSVSKSPITHSLRELYWRQVRAECS